ncbi:sulfotransferase domain-containing protein [Pelagibacterium sp. H642]|uniref:sulfotransferase domain-containing protein n=1 Tax=Pelagibacterium sp. H642 TaxID=1881069 RepID=UPI0028167876|nr:sulfotransferase domain-containing protein [Pelagibacterium sp. H642]WMT90616.1 sulfotransferase domain-containing protein [Pelagibacterium sp. H642]
MSEPQAKPIRPLYFVASYPRSGSNWVRSAIFLMIAMAQPNPPKRIDMRNIDNIIPLDSQGRFYKEVTGKDAGALGEEEVAEARPLVHQFLASQHKGFPVVKTHAIRGTFHGHPTFNTKVSVGGTYVVRNPLDVAAALVEATGLQPVRVIEAMMTKDRRVKANPHLVSEPQGSWSQNVASWTAQRQPAVHVIRFEDLRADPAKQLKRLAAHMKIPVSDKGLATAVGLLAETHKARGREAGARDYRETLKPLHARAIIEAHGVQMDAHGYLTDKVLQYADIDRRAALVLAQRHAPKIAN